MPESSVSSPPPVLAPHNNQQLFSDYYLNRKLPERDDWRALAGEAAVVREAVAALMDGYKPNVCSQITSSLVEWSSWRDAMLWATTSGSAWRLLVFRAGVVMLA